MNYLWKLVGVVFLLFFSLITSFSQHTVVGYYPDWGKWMTPSYTCDKVDFDQITHVAWSFVSPTADGHLRGNAIDDPSDLDLLANNAHLAGKKILLSLGGAGNCENFVSVASDNDKRSFFLHQLKQFVLAHDIDGVDMDWEYSVLPSHSDTAAYTRLLLDMRDTLGNDMLLTAAIPCSPYYGKWFAVETFIDKLDWIGFMTYDITGAWDELARYNSPLFPNGNRTTWSWKETVDYFSSRGVPPSKMLPGVASFGFNFGGCSGPGSVFSSGKADYIGYASVAAAEDWDFYWDDIAKVPYALTPEGGYVTFDDPRSVAEKARWIIDKGLRGAIVWELSLDYMLSGQQPIMDSLSKILLPDDPSQLEMEDSRPAELRLLWDGVRLTPIGLDETFEIKIIDMSGRAVCDLSVRNGENKDFSFLPQGSYLVSSGRSRIVISR